jgi:WD40 repeat protein
MMSVTDENVVVRIVKQRLVIVDSASLEEVARVDEFGHPIRGLAFSHDGTKLASSHEDSTVIIWDMSKLGTDTASSP